MSLPLSAPASTEVYPSTGARTMALTRPPGGRQHAPRVGPAARWPGQQRAPNQTGPALDGGMTGQISSSRSWRQAAQQDTTTRLSYSCASYGSKAIRAGYPNDRSVRIVRLRVFRTAMCGGRGSQAGARYRSSVPQRWSHGNTTPAVPRSDRRGYLLCLPGHPASRRVPTPQAKETRSWLPARRAARAVSAAQPTDSAPPRWRNLR